MRLQHRYHRSAMAKEQFAFSSRVARHSPLTMRRSTSRFLDSFAGESDTRGCLLRLQQPVSGG